MSALIAAGTGFVAGLSLILAIGAQNAFVLRQGGLGRHVGVVVAICVISDAVLIVAGVAGAGALVRAHPGLLRWMTWAGAAYLIWFAVTAFRAARREDSLRADAAVPAQAVALTALALTWLNPHVYLDTVVLLGSISTSFAGARWAFAAGAVAASALWFPLLAYAGKRLAPWLARPRTWRVFNIVIGVAMLVLAAGLVWGSTDAA